MKQKILLVCGCFVSTGVWWHGMISFEGEFGGGVLARNNATGGLLLMLAMALAYNYPRAASATALVASVLSLPLYLYLLFPLPFRKIWPGGWATPAPRESFVWNGWWAAGAASIVVVAVVSALLLLQSRMARRRVAVGA